MATIGETLAAKEAQRAIREAREKDICAYFDKLRANYPDVAVSVIFEDMATTYKTDPGKPDYPKTSMGVRNILIKHGKYETRQRYTTETRRSI